MKKEKWEIKKLGEVCETINGLWTGKKGPFINVGVIRNTNFTKDCKLDDRDIAYLDVELKQFNQRKLKYGDIIVEKSGGSTNQPVGRVVLFDKNEGNFSFSNFTSAIRIKNTEEINSNFLHKYLSFLYFTGYTERLQSNTTGIRNLDFNGYKKTEIPIPPLPVQEKIVSELDTLHRLKELQEQQLAELDNLAQSTFYSMFGDPIENEKGWEVRSIESISSSLVRGPFGSALKKEFFVPKSNSTYKIYEQKNAIQNDATLGSYYIDKDRYKTLTRFTVEPSDIIMSCSGTIGKLLVIPQNAEKGIINQALLKFSLNSSININFFLFLMDKLIDNLDKKGSGIQNLGSVKYIKSLSFGLPPLSLQTHFATRIEKIESQKELIKQSIAQTQLLIDYTMDKYFG